MKATKDLGPLKTSLAKIERLKKEIAAKRDELRKAVDEVEGILETLDETVNGLESGAREFERAVDAMSEYL